LDDVRGARARLDAAPAALRRWEWRHLHAELDASLGTLALSGRRIGWAAPSPDGTRALVWSTDPNEIALVDLADGRARWTRPGSRSALGLAFSRRGDLAVVGTETGDVEVRDAATGAVRRTWRAHEDEVISAAFDAEGRRLATASRDRTAKVWSLEDGALLATLAGHTDRVLWVEFLPDDRRIVTGGRDGTLRLWDAASGALERVTEAHAGSVESVAVSPEGTWLASGGRDGAVRLWDVASGRSLASGLHGNNVRAVAFSPDGATFASASWDRTVRLWSAEDGREIARLRGHTAAVASLGYAAGGRRVVSFAVDGEVKTWASAASLAPRLGDQPGVVAAIAFDPAGRRLAASGHDGTIRVWDVEERRLLATRVDRADLADRRRSLAFGPGGATVLSAPRFRPASAWSLAEGDARAVVALLAPFAWVPGRDAWLGAGTSSDWVLVSPSFDAVLERAPWPEGTGASVLSVAPAGTRFACASLAGDAELWRTDPLRREARLESLGPLSTLALSREGDLLAIGTGRGEVRVLPTEGERRPLWSASVGQAPITALAFSPDASRLAVGSAEGEVRLWDVASGQPILVLYGLRVRTEAIAFSPDGRRLAAAGGAFEDPSGSIALWDAP
jgi:WD40 repeat protein